MQESDAYYNVCASELKVDLNKDKEIEYSDIASKCVVGDRIVGEVFISYKVPDDVQKELDRLDLTKDSDMDKYIKIYNDYQKREIILFDLDGNAINSIPLDDDCDFRNAYAGQNGEIMIATSHFDLKECASVPGLFVISSEGEKLRDIELQTKDSMSDMQVYVLDNGNLLMASIGKFYILDSEGKVIAEESNPELNGTMLCSGGKWYAVMPQYDADGTTAYIQEVDTTSGKLVGEKIKTSDTVFFLNQGEKDCFILNANGIEKYDLLTQTSTPVLAWKDTDVNSSNLSMTGARISSENEMVFFQMKLQEELDYTSMNSKAGNAAAWSVVKLSKADKNPHAGKMIMKLGLNGYTDPCFIERVINYNLDPNNPIRIEICDYTAGMQDTLNYSTIEKALGESVSKLTMDMLSGNGPDILVGYSDMSQFNNENMLLDLNPLLDGDSSINRADLFDNILRAYEEDGKLYTIPLTYTLEGLAVNTKFSGTKENLTFSEFDQIASTLPDNVQLLSSKSCEDLLKAWMLHLSSHFIDNANKTVNFESEEFRMLLESVKKYGQVSGVTDNTIAPLVNDVGGFSYNDDVLFAQDMIATCNTSISDLQFYSAFFVNRPDGQILFTGVPSLSGMGMSAKGQLSMSITTSCPDPEMAWAFISSFLKEDNQQVLSFNTDTFPLNKQAFQENCRIEIEVNQQMLEEVRANPDRYSETEKYLELTQKQADDLMALILGVSSSESYDADVLNIVLEEAAGYFAGQRTVEDVCSNIQNRASLVVQER